MPIILLAIFSFNSDQFGYSWRGFSIKWYQMLFEHSELWEALLNSLIVSMVSVFLAITMGTLCICYVGSRTIKKIVSFFYINVSIPEIVLAVALLMLFSVAAVPLGIVTLIAAHTVIGFGYVVPIIYDRYRQIDMRIVEAAYDLGATRYQAIRLIVFPLLKPAIVSAGLLMFIVSFDDFLLSFFCSGSSTQTLPVYIYSLIRAGTSPMVNALSCLLLLIGFIVVIAVFFTENMRSGYDK